MVYCRFIYLIKLLGFAKTRLYSFEHAKIMLISMATLILTSDIGDIEWGLYFSKNYRGH